MKKEGDIGTAEGGKRVDRCHRRFAE